MKLVLRKYSGLSLDFVEKAASVPALYSPIDYANVGHPSGKIARGAGNTY
jgi:hypothetical protein